MVTPQSSKKKWLTKNITELLEARNHLINAKVTQDLAKISKEITDSIKKIGNKLE